MERLAFVLGTVVVIAMFAVAPSVATAEPATTAEGDIAIAKEFWGREPTGCLSIAFTTVVVQEAAGEATEPAPGALPIPCVIAVHEVDRPEGFTPSTVCVTVVHEWGHLLGEPHSSDPSSVMYPSGGPVPACLGSETPEEEVNKELVPIRWSEWRELRAACGRARGPYRMRCGAQVRNQRLILERASAR